MATIRPARAPQLTIHNLIGASKPNADARHVLGEHNRRDARHEIGTNVSQLSLSLSLSLSLILFISFSFTLSLTVSLFLSFLTLALSVFPSSLFSSFPFFFYLFLLNSLSDAHSRSSKGL